MIKVFPEQKPPVRKLYCYHKAFCQECGNIHIYRKSAELEEIFYACAPQWQTSLLPEDNSFQPELFDKN